jgi:signal transduction histidine kinase
MVSDAAHELRTPLASLKTQLELAHDDFGDAPALAAHLTGAEASVERLSSLATNLLELSRLESNEAAAGAASTSELVTELMGSVDRARMLALAKGAEIGFDLVETDEERRYPIDAQAFGRVADNLLSNAVAAVAPGGAVEAILRQDAGGVILEVTDNGPGLPPEFLAKAFERFSRPDSARAASAGGSGLGLALVKATAVAAGGTVELQNEMPGLAVRMTIPNM